jgi:hypothetical protein
MNKEKIFILDSDKSFKMAENFKGELENEGFRVKTVTYGLHGVRITGIKDAKEHQIENLPTKYKGKDYNEAIDRAVQRARTEYLYPSSATGQGMKNLFGRRYYADLIAANICEAKIPNDLKRQLMGKEKFNDCNKNR